MPEDSPSVDWLIHGGTVVTMDAEERIFTPGAVAVRGSEITALGSEASVRDRVRARETINASGQVVMPGLINAHTHAAMTIFRGLVDDIPLEPWLRRIWEVEQAQATGENVGAGTLLAFLEMIRGGTTTAADMYWQRDVTTDLAGRIGFRLLNGPSFIDFTGPDGIGLDEREPRAREFLERYRDHPLISTCVQVHATYTVSTEVLRRAGELAREYAVPFVTHLSESAQEVATVRKRFGKSPPEYLDSLGLLGPRALLVHCVHLTDREIRLLAERGASVAHCPQSNLKIGSGIARVADLLEAGVTVGLGTDGAASNNDLDLWEEMRTAALLQKGLHRDPTKLPATSALRMATIDGAKAMGLEERIGSLEPGKKADLIVVDFGGPHLVPMYEVRSHLVYAANKGDVRTVMIGGRLLMRNGEILGMDEERIKAQAREVARKIRGG